MSNRSPLLMEFSPPRTTVKTQFFNIDDSPQHVNKARSKLYGPAPTAESRKPATVPSASASAGPSSATSSPMPRASVVAPTSLREEKLRELVSPYLNQIENLQNALNIEKSKNAAIARSKKSSNENQSTLITSNVTKHSEFEKLEKELELYKEQLQIETDKNRKSLKYFDQVQELRVNLDHFKAANDRLTQETCQLQDLVNQKNSHIKEALRIISDLDDQRAALETENVRLHSLTEKLLAIRNN
jgi:hypothetical protein